jgi:hypothetical protein
MDKKYRKERDKGREENMRRLRKRERTRHWKQEEK